MAGRRASRGTFGLVQGGVSAGNSSTATAASSAFGATKGKRLWKSGALKAASQGFSQRVEMNSKDPRALRGAGMTAYKAMKWDVARKYLHSGFLDETAWRKFLFERLGTL